MTKTVKITKQWTQTTEDLPVLTMANIRIEIDEDHPEKVWIWMIEDGEKAEGGSFDLSAFMDCVLQFYNYHY